jgi:hypothetical protein
VIRDFTRGLVLIMMNTRTGVLFAALVSAALGGSAAAQAAATCDDSGPVKQVKRLGNPATSMHRPPLKTEADFRALFDTAKPAGRRYVALVHDLLAQACVADKELEILRAAREAPVQAVSVAPGTSLRWMGSKRGARRTRVLRPAVWAGKAPFEAFQFQTIIGDSLYTFAVPKACSNLTLLDVQQLPPLRAEAAVDTECELPGGPQTRVRLSADPSSANVKLTAVTATCGGTAKELNAGNGWTAAFPGEARGLACTYGATDSLGRPVLVTERRGRLDCPRPPSPPPPTCSVAMTQAPDRGCWAVTMTSNQPGTVELLQNGQPLPAKALAKGVTAPTHLDAGAPATVRVCQEGTYTAKVKMDGADARCEASLTLDRASLPMAALAPFAAAYFGKERRAREEFNGGRCAPMFGPQLGLSIRPDGNPMLEIAPSVGVAINTRDSGNTSLFAEVELNRHFGEGRGKGYIGTGLGLWDFTHSETTSPTWLVHYGIRLSPESARAPIYWVGQGRLFLDELDDIDNNYQFWTGLRVRFK